MMVAELRQAHDLIMEGGMDHFKVSNEFNRRPKERVAELFGTGVYREIGHGCRKTDPISAPDYLAPQARRY